MGTLLTEQLFDAGVLLVTVQGRAVRPAKPWGLGVWGGSQSIATTQTHGGSAVDVVPGGSSGCWATPQNQEGRGGTAPGLWPQGPSRSLPAAVLGISLRGGAVSPGLGGALTILPKQRCIST